METEQATRVKNIRQEKRYMGDAVINVVMTGGRRCGKTSVLAAMQACLYELKGSAGIEIWHENTYTRDKLTEIRRDARELFANKDAREWIFPRKQSHTDD